MKSYNLQSKLYTSNSHDNSSSSIFDKRIWCIDDVASVLNVSKGHIYNLTSRREIPFRQKGKRGKLYFLPEEIFDWINEGD